jgi:signal transduction histidine kinase
LNTPVLTRTRNSPWFNRAAIALSLVLICALDWRAGKGTFTQFYSVPVALLALLDGWVGGLAAAGLASIGILVFPGEAGVLTQLLSCLALGCLGVTLGVVFERERKQKSILQRTADQLGSVYERVQANFEAMKRIEKLSAIGQLSAGFAHEIRNPLASIAGAAGILRRNEKLEPKHAKCVEIIASECDRLNGLLTNFLDFARPRRPHLQSVFIDSVLDNVLALASHGVRGKVLRFEKQVQPDLPRVECDPEQLEQVLLNLMINATEASPNDEAVTLSAATQDGNVAIQVIDHGYGVVPAHIDRLFDPFFTTKEHGTGLGLPVAHQIMTQMGGTLSAQRNPGKGMTFSVLLPAKHPGA